MSDVVASALVQIEPDFSGFEAQLTRGLTAAVQRAQKAATIKLQVDVQQQKQVQQFEKSMGGADKASQALEGHLAQVNTTLGKVSSQLAATNAGIAQLSRIMYELAVNSRQAAQATGGPLSKAFETLGAVTRIVETITRVAANVATIVGFARQIKELGATFKAEAQSAKGFIGHLKALGAALDKTFTAEQAQGMQRAAAAGHNVADAIHGAGDAVSKAGQKFGKRRKIVQDTTEDLNNFSRANISAVQHTVALASAEEEVIKKTGRFRALLARATKDRTASIAPPAVAKARVEEVLAEPVRKTRAPVVHKQAAAAIQETAKQSVRAALAEKVLTVTTNVSTKAFEQATDVVKNLGAAKDALSGKILGTITAEGQAINSTTVSNTVINNQTSFLKKLAIARGAVAKHINLGVVQEKASAAVASVQQKVVSQLTKTTTKLSAAKDVLVTKTVGAKDAVKNMAAVVPNTAHSLKDMSDSIGQASGAVQRFAAGEGPFSRTVKTFKGEGEGLGGVLDLLKTKFLGLGVGGAAGVAVAGIGLVTTGMGKAIIGLAGKASRLQESTNAVTVTLDDAAEPFRRMIGDVTALGSTQLELNESITPIVPLLKNTGLVGEELADKLNLLVRRGIDLGSIFNKSANEVLPALGAALRGEVDPAERLGISFNAAAVEQEALAQGAVKVAGQLTEQSKVQARLALVMKKSEFAANDYTNTQTGLANATRNYKAVLTGLGFAFSEVFLKGSEKITAALNKLISTAGPSLTRFFKTITPLVTDFSAVLADVVVGGLFQSLVEASAAASNVFLPVLQAVLEAVRHLLKVFEVFNVLTARILPGNLNILTLALTSLLIIGTITRITRILTATFTLLSGVMGTRLGVAIGATSAKMLTLVGTIGKFAGPIGIALTMFALMNKKVEDTGAIVKKLKGELDDGKQLKEFLNVGPVKFEDTNVLQKVSTFTDRWKKTWQQKGPASILLGGIDDADIWDSINEDKLKERLAASFEIDPEFAKEMVVEAEKAKSNMAPLLRKWFDELNVDTVKEKLKEATKTALEDIKKAISGALSNATSLVAAQKSVEDSRKKVSDLDTSIAEKNKEIKDLRDNTLRIAEEEATARERVADTEKRLLDLDRQRTDLIQEREQLLFDEQRRQEEFLPTLAEFEDQALTANIGLFRAKKAIEEAQKAINDAVKAGLVDETTHINLAGLSIDQIKSKLSNLRATLAAQKAVAKAEKPEPLSKEELQNNLLEAQIGERDAQRQIVDLAQTKADFLRDNTIKQREFNEQVIELGVREAQQDADRVKAQRDQKLAAQELQQTLDGEIGIKLEIATKTKELTGFETQRRDAVKEVTGAELELNLELAKASGIETDILNAEIALVGWKKGQLTDDKAITTEYGLQLNVLNEQLRVLGMIGSLGAIQTLRTLSNDLTARPPGGLLPNISLQEAKREKVTTAMITDLLLSTVNKATGARTTEVLPQTAQNWVNMIIADPRTDIMAIIRDILKQVGLVLPGVGDGPGGFVGGTALRRVESVLGNFPTARITSTYRTPERNRAAGGSPTSYHLDKDNPAVDIGGPTNVLNELYRRLAAMGGWRELLWQVKGHYDHIHAAAAGAFVTSKPTMLVGEGSSVYPEYVIPTDPRYAKRARSLFGRLAGDLGTPLAPFSLGDATLGSDELAPLVSPPGVLRNSGTRGPLVAIERKRNQALAKEIAEALAAVLVDSGETNITIHQNVSTQDPYQAAKHAERGIRRYLDSL